MHLELLTPAQEDFSAPSPLAQVPLAQPGPLEAALQAHLAQRQAVSGILVQQPRQVPLEQVPNIPLPLSPRPPPVLVNWVC